MIKYLLIFIDKYINILDSKLSLKRLIFSLSGLTTYVLYLIYEICSLSMLINRI